MSRIVRNGVLIYESRGGQFGHMTVDEFMKAVKKDRGKKIYFTNPYSIEYQPDFSKKEVKKRKKWFRKGGFR